MARQYSQRQDDNQRNIGNAKAPTLSGRQLVIAVSPGLPCLVRLNRREQQDNPEQRIERCPGHIRQHGNPQCPQPERHRRGDPAAVEWVSGNQGCSDTACRKILLKPSKAALFESWVLERVGLNVPGRNGQATHQKKGPWRVWEVGGRAVRPLLEKEPG